MCWLEVTWTQWNLKTGVLRLLSLLLSSVFYVCPFQGPGLHHQQDKLNGNQEAHSKSHNHSCTGMGSWVTSFDARLLKSPNSFPFLSGPGVSLWVSHRWMWEHWIIWLDLALKLGIPSCSDLAIPPLLNKETQTLLMEQFGYQRIYDHVIRMGFKMCWL